MPLLAATPVIHLVSSGSQGWGWVFGHSGCWGDPVRHLCVGIVSIHCPCFLGPPVRATLDQSSKSSIHARETHPGDSTTHHGPDPRLWGRKGDHHKTTTTNDKGQTPTITAPWGRQRPPPRQLLSTVKLGMGRRLRSANNTLFFI